MNSKFTINFCLLIIIFSCSISYSDTTSNWKKLSTPISTHLRKVFFVDSLSGWVGGDSGIIIHTNNGGNNWQVQSSGIESEIRDIFFLNNRLGWGIAWSYSEETPIGSVILSTTNGGSFWRISDFPEENVFLNCIHFVDSSIGFLGTGNGTILRTIDGGINWEKTKITTGPYSNFPILDFKFITKQFAFANGGIRDVGGVIWRTGNFGLDWDSGPVGPEPILQIDAIDSNYIVGVGGDYEFGAGVVISSDAGISWDYRSLEIFGFAHSVSFRKPTEGWSTIGIEKKFLLTRDSAKTWEVIPTIDSTAIYELQFVDSLTGFAVGERGTVLKYKYKPPIVNSIDDAVLTTPIGHKLFQNFPNPFNPETVIRYQLMVNGHVSLKVYDILGREVATLVDEIKDAGFYHFPFSIRQLTDHFPLSNGIYFYQLRAGSYLETRKMIILK
ncbi:MAG: T9SS type A sorting domain-containing protein [Ignavibacteria bacterium]|nr:T9SS type A sorting domain-containing protein [Ignavibacteria bacterium]